MPKNVERRTTFTTLLWPYRRALAIALIAVIGAGVANLLQPWPLKVVFDLVGGSKPVHGWLGNFIHSNFGPHKIALVEFAAAALIAIAGLSALCSYLETYMTSSVGQWVTHDLRSILYNHLQLLSLRYLHERQTGDLMSRLTTDIDAVQNFIVSGFVGFITDCITLLGMAAVMVYLNWRFTLVALAVAPVLFPLTYLFTRRSKKQSREVRKKQSQVVSHMQENLAAIGVVKAFGLEAYEQQRLEQESRESVDLALRARRFKARLTPLAEIIVAIGTAIVLWLGGKLVLAGALSAGSLIVFIWYLGKMYKPMQDFAKLADSYSKAAVGYERIREVLDAPAEVQDLPTARLATRFSGEIGFDSVNFSYVPGQPVLTNVHFNIGAGQMFALVGPTGAGKSTIAALVARLYDPDSGAVKIDGRDLREFTQKSLRDQISFVLQESILFRTTLAENIAFGKPDAKQQEIIRAAELADADEFISKLPNGYDTLVGERGVTLSGGQRQRIAIARAIIRDSPILILDEPSSGLDAASEKLVFEALERLMKGRTVLLIAHRLATVRRANMILVVDHGRIVEQGSHEQLLEVGGIYSNLYQLQFATKAPDLSLGIA